jgi:hypothetical protein
MTTTVYKDHRSHTAPVAFDVDELRLGGAHFNVYTPGADTGRPPHSHTSVHGAAEPTVRVNTLRSGTKVVTFRMFDNFGTAHRISLFGVDATVLAAALTAAVNDEDA